MQLMIPSNVRREMQRHIRRAGKREIGGILMGEEVGAELFRIVKFSVDSVSGTRARFVRDADHHDRELRSFFERTGTDYRRYNYLGEWHTHPSFDVHPSLQDMASMEDLVSGSRDVNFAVLFIAQVRWLWRFQCSAYLFVRGCPPKQVEVIYEGNVKIEEVST